MDNSKAERIITDLLNNPNVYKEMAKKENEIWGKVFSDSHRKEAYAKDQEAAKILRVNRDIPTLGAVIKEHGLSPQMGLSLACGSGRTERRLLSEGICQAFHGVDLAGEALDEARELAAEQNLNITYEQGDLNSILLQEEKYDLVVAINCLHHVLKLEHIASEIYRSMTPSGILWIRDYIGETQFQYSAERLELVNFILSILPERMHYNSFKETLGVKDRIVNKIVRKEPGTLASPFEAIRSADIMPIFLEYFDIIEYKEYNSIFHLACPEGTRGAYLENEESRALFELLFFLDRMLIEKQILSPCAGVYFLQRRKGKLGAGRKEEMGSPQGKLQEYVAALQAKETELEQLQQQLVESQSLLAQKDDQLQEHAAALQAKGTELEQLQHQLVENQSLLGQKDGQLLMLNTKVEKSARDVAQLMGWIEELDRGILALLGSQRWKMAHSLGEFRRKVLLRPPVPLVTDLFDDVLEKFRTWRKGVARGPVQPTQ